MAVRIRMKRLGRRHRPFYRVCALDSRAPRDGRVIEELGYYDPMIPEVDARAVLNGERIDYWLGVGAKPSDKVGVLIKKYGSNGTHVEKQKEAIERMKVRRPQAPPPTPVPPATQPETAQPETAQPETAQPETAESGQQQEATEQQTNDSATATETPAAETPATETPAAETPAAEAEAEQPEKPE